MIFMLMSGFIFVMFFVIFGTAMVRMIGQWNKNNHSPQLTVAASVVSRRTHTSHHHHAGTHHAHHSSSYYVTFQFESGDRLELMVPSSQFGYLVEGDRGKLTFQGTRFLAFERT